MSGYVLIEIGCAECRWDNNDPLVESMTFFDTLEQARASYTGDTPIWRPHPLGGVFHGFGSGDVWIAPVEVFSRVTDTP